jgi:hypothetical protein
MPVAWQYSLTGPADANGNPTWIAVSLADPLPVQTVIGPSGTGTAIVNAASVANNTTVAAGRSIQISASVAGSATLTLSGGTSLIVNFQVGDNIYPYAVTKIVLIAGTISHTYNLT